MSISSILTLSLSLLAGGEAPQWGGFRGNNGAGTASATRLPATLDPEGNLMWRVDVPSGYSSPTIAGKDLYLTGTDDKAKLFTLCLDAYSGEERWRKELAYDGKRPGQNSPAAPSPATDGERVYALFHHVGLVAYDKTGKELWKKPLGPFNIPHGLSTSPVLHGDLVILQVDQDDGAYLVAYDKLTGAERWRIARPSWWCRARSRSPATRSTRARSCGGSTARAGSRRPCPCSRAGSASSTPTSPPSARCSTGA